MAAVPSPAPVPSGLDRPRLMRRRNARIAGKAALHHFDPEALLPFLCECSDDRCPGLLRISLREFDQGGTGHFLTLPGHQVEGAKIVRVRDGCWLYRVDA